VQPVGYPTVVTLAEAIVEVRIHHRIDEPAEHLGAIGHDVAVVKGNDRGLSPGEDIAIGHPATSPFSLLAEYQAILAQHAVDRLEAGTVVPYDPVALGQAGEKLSSPGKLPCISTIQAYDDFMKIGDFCELLDDVTQGRSFDFTEERGKHQGYGTLVGQRYEILLESLRIGLAEAVESGNDTRLKEVAHIASLREKGARLLAELNGMLNIDGTFYRTFRRGPNAGRLATRTALNLTDSLAMVT
jgi:hypothetical protein